jgi:hypothetical protein
VGTRIPLTCRYHGPAAPQPYATPTTYQLVVVSAADPSTRSVASWQVLPGQDASVAGSNDLRPDQIAEVQLRDATGHGAAGGFAVPLSTAPAHGRPGRAG